MKKLLQVFDYYDMPDEYQVGLAVFFEAPNDSYHRWYPHHSWDYPGGDLKAGVNTWLREKGKMEGEGDEYFYVLIRIHW
ncbi:MAG: hypothetical protein KAR39_10925 [Thermoplasmata archaeon]|nr:hypothetical protein [Thermoplasmata archaeon]